MESLVTHIGSARVACRRTRHGKVGSATIGGMLFTLACTVSSVLGAPAPPAKVAPDLQAAIQRQPAASVSVIVQLDRPVNGGDAGQVQQNGGRVRNSWRIIPAYAADLPAAAVAKLAALPQVRRISPDRVLRPTLDTTAKAVGMDAARAIYGATGNNIGVAVLDTGIQTGPEFGNNLRGWVDLVNGASNPYDDNGHGTHVAGVLSGTSQATISAGSALRFQGLLPRSNLVAVKVLGQDGSGLVSTIISALEWCQNNRNPYKLRVINLSLGHVPAESYTTDPLCQACESAVRSGLVVCVAAGNWGKDANGNTLYGGILSPGVDPWVITVGAAKTRDTAPRSDDTVATFSSRGPTYIDGLAKPDLVAPGNRMISVRAVGSYLDAAYPGNRLPRSAYLPGATGDSPYFILSGTSMATPVAAAAAAMLLEQNPSLTPNAVKAILMYSAQTLSLGLSTGLSDLTQGAGYLNIPGALEIATRINASAPTGAYWLTANLGGATLIQGETITWSRALFWGNRRAGGDTISHHQFAWGSNVAWGEGGNWASNVAWGENAVTADPSWQSAATWSNAQTWAAGSPTTSTLVRGD